MTFDPCPISRTVSLLGGRWTPLILRDIAYGNRRFDRIQRNLGVSRATLSTRLTRLEEEGLIERTEYQAHPPRYEYELSEKGRSLWPVLAAMWTYGSEWLFEDPTPGKLVDRGTGEEVRPVVVDEATGGPIDLSRIRLVARALVQPPAIAPTT